MINNSLKDHEKIARQIIYAIETKKRTKLRALKSEDLSSVLYIIKKYVETR